LVLKTNSVQMASHTHVFLYIYLSLNNSIKRTIQASLFFDLYYFLGCGICLLRSNEIQIE